jgi:adenylate cyclase
MIAPIETFRGAVMMVDMVGFTRLVGSLSEEGARGIDALQRFLSSYYTDLVGLVHDFGGVIYQFAGDSILACFEMESVEQDAQTALRATQCALQIQKALERWRRVELLGRGYATAAAAAFCSAARTGGCTRCSSGAPSRARWRARRRLRAAT